jgi:threonine dehydrogenase-like Zn-dependent dehydrogenase
MTSLHLNIIDYKEIALTGSYGVGVPSYGNPDLYGVALKLIQDKTAPVAQLITHNMTADDIHQAFDAIRPRSGLKATIDIGKSLNGREGDKVSG